MRSSAPTAPGGLLALAALAALSALQPASAGDIYINGVRADGAREISLSGVDVHIDAAGDIHIHAPDYEIEVVGAPADGATPDGAASPPASAPQPAPSNDAPPAPLGIWWLVTEDHSSINHRVDVSIGGQLVATILSGQPPLYLDLSEHLRVGANAITFTPSTEGDPGGGALHIYVGALSQEGGDFQMPDPAIDYVRRSTDSPADLPSTLSLDVSAP